MSYFFGTPIINHDNHNGKTDKKKHRRKVSMSEYELEPVHGCRHRRKHTSKSRCSKSRSMISNLENEQSISTPKTKYKRHKEVGKLLNDNEKLMAGVATTPESGFMEDSSERETQLVKYKSRFSRLEKSYQEIGAEKLKLQTQLKKRESEYEELHSHYQELIKHVQISEREKAALFIESKKYKSENSQLSEDVSLLKVLIYRLNVEIKRYQEKLQLENHPVDIQDIDLTTENKKVSESWAVVNNHVLEPLLNAYQENLEEKDQLIKKYRKEMDESSVRCKEVVDENNELRKEIEDYKSQMDKYKTEIRTISEDASLIKEENDVLQKQQSLQNQKLHEIHSIYEKKVQSMSQDNNKLHSDYLACKTELSNLQGKYEILNEGFEKLKKNSERTMPVSVHTDSIEECRRLFEELKSQYYTEKKKLLSQLKKFEETNPENEKLLAITTAERDHLKQSTKNLEKSLKRTQYKLECVQKAVCSIQVSRDSFKRQLAKTTSYCEELVLEQEKLLAERKELIALLHARQKENEDIQNLGDNIVQRMGTLKNQLKSVQKGAKEQLYTVEKQMKCQELGAGQMKTDHLRELHRLKQLIKQKEVVIGKLQRDKFAAQDNLEFIWKTATNEDKKVKDVLRNIKVYNV